MLKKFFMLLIFFLDFNKKNISVANFQGNNSQRNFDYFIQKIEENPDINYSFSKIVIYNFPSFQHLIFNCLNLTNSIGTLSFKSRKYLILDNNLQLDLSLKFNKQIIFKFAYLKAIISNLKTFDHLFENNHSISILFFYSLFFLLIKTLQNQFPKILMSLLFFLIAGIIQILIQDFFRI